MKKLKLYVDFGRPFTLLPPALGVVSGAVTAWGAHGTRSPLTASLLLPVLWGALMAGSLLGSVPVALIYSFFVEYYVSSMTGAVKE